MSQENAKPVNVKQLFKLREFRYFWGALAVSSFGDNLTRLTILILVNKLTGSAGAVALVGILLAIPQVTIGLVAGVFVDRYNRQKIMIVSDLLRGGLMVALGVASISGNLWPLYTLVFIQAAVGTFFNPARLAVMPLILPKEGLLAANSFGQMTIVVNTVLGSLAAGLLVGLFDLVWLPFILDAATFVLAAWLVSRVRVPAPTAPAASQPAISLKTVLGQLVEGLQIIGRNRQLLGVVLGLGFCMLGLGAVNILILPMLVNVLNVPETWLGLVQLAQVVSMILSGALLAARVAHIKPGYMVSGGIFGLAFLIIPMGFVNAVWQFLLILFLIGWLITPLQASISTVLQTEGSDQTRGRVGATFQTVLALAELLSVTFAGVFGELIGIRLTFILAGGCLVVAAAVTFATMNTKSRQVIAAAPVPVTSDRSS